MPSERTLDQFLKDSFAGVHVDRALKHFNGMIAAFQQGAWEQAIAKAAKFVEAVLKSLVLRTGGTLPTSSREFKVDRAINELGQLAQVSFPDSVRLTIPRACRFAYDVACNRGARHDPDEIDPNEMDANVVTAISSWILAEMIRYSQKGALDSSAASELVRGLTERKYPFVEEIEGRVYFHIDGISAPDAAILTLWHRHPARRTKEQIIASVIRHGHNRKNAQMAVARLGRLVDVDEHETLRLLQPGLRRADELVKSLGI